jgi:hypothetical protein
MRRGVATVEMLIGLTIAVLAIGVAWNAYLSVTRQDGGARHLADRLETYALVHATLERDLMSHGFAAEPQVAAGGQAFDIGEIHWTFDADRGVTLRNGRAVGFPVLSDTSYQLKRERTTGTLTLFLRFRSGPAVEGATARIAVTWLARDPSTSSTPSSIL